MEVLIEKLDNYGRGICFINNKITFVNNALKDEIVDIKIIKSTSKYNEAKVLKIIKRSNERIEPICKHYYDCGGCNLMHMTYQEELKFKENKIKDIMYKYAHITNDKIKSIIPNDSMNYRNKATFKVLKKVGYFKEKTHEIIPISNCIVVSPRINEILEEIKNLDLSNINEIIIRVSDLEDLVIFKGSKIDIKNLELKNVILDNGSINILKGNSYIIDKIGDYKFYISSRSFFQVNKYNVEKLYNKVLEYVKNSSNLLDLYCGTGSIGIYLSKVCEKITGVEINKLAIEDANKNKELNNLDNINFVCLDAAKFSVCDNFDTIVLDPPRSGLDRDTINYLFSINPKKIVYVSCDPMTLARDLNILKDKFEIIEITPVDMFSRTYHVESVCILKRIDKY